MELMSDFRIVIASLPDRENCVCEIYYKNVEWAEISNEHSEIMIQFYPPPNNKCWEFPIDMALEVLQMARRRFIGH